MKKLLSLILAVVMVLGLVACGNDAPETTAPAGESTPSAGDVAYEEIDLADAVAHEDYTSVYDMIGKNVTIDMVTEDPDTGLATVEYEGKTYELGMDFLSMAMVYNCTPAGDYATQTDVYNQWWKLFIQRWNYMVPEVPLYSNQYFDLYNAKIENFVTSPFWSPRNAIIAANVKEGEENSVILGSSTELSGAFRSSAWGKSSPGSSDQDIELLTSGHATAYSNFAGDYEWNFTVLAEEPSFVKNEDGTLTCTLKINNGLTFSDGSPITAKNYVAGILANSTEVAVAAGGTGISGMQLVGYDEFKAYVGNIDYEAYKAEQKAAAEAKAAENGNEFDGDAWDAAWVEPSATFTGIKLLDDNTFSLTYQADYADYYYVTTYAAVGPEPLALYLGENDVVVNENFECSLTDEFYAKVEKDGTEVFAMADVINANLAWDSELPYSGPYVVSNYDASTLTATLSLNPNYAGDTVRGKASIETITYVKMVEETQMDQFKAGQIDVLAGITGGDETKAALALVESDPTKYAETHYDRAGYGKLAFRCDLGPTAMTEVRQAIIYTINRPEFAQTFTGGFGSVVNGPYYELLPAFQANADTINLNAYAYSADSAVAVLEEGGWIYNEKGEEFVAGTDAVRYKKLSGYELSAQNLQYSSIDGAYKTVKINGEYYMPLAINWYGTQPNSVTDQLITAWQTNPNATSELGMYIGYTSADFTTGLYGEYLQIEAYGWDGVAKCAAINFATGYNSAIFDQSWYWTINQDMYADYSNNYLMDEADFWENYQ